MKQYLFKTQKAFTLAEVLITLAVIGVVAAVSIPSLMNDIDGRQYKTAWKKTFAIYSEAYKQLAYYEGGIADFSSNADKVVKVASYLNITSMSSLYNNCTDDYSYMRPGGSSCYNATILTTDGVRSVIHGYNQDIAFDVNGDKPPNKPGKDLFAATYTSTGRLIPYGSEGSQFSTYECDPNADDSVGGKRQKWACSSAYLKE